MTAQDGLLAFGALLFIVDPVAVVPTFLAMTRDNTDAQRRGMAVRASLTCAAVLLTFLIAGPTIFLVFGLELPGFRVAGGLILLLVAIDMLRTHRTTQESDAEIREGAEKDDVGITPLGIPMLAGPGAISQVMVHASRAEQTSDYAILAAAIVGVSAVSVVVLALAVWVQRVLGRTGINILSRVMGLLLAAMATQMILDGLRESLLARAG